MLRDIGRVMLRPDVTGERAMEEGEADKAAILTVIRAETEAWLQRDFEARLTGCFRPCMVSERTDSYRPRSATGNRFPLSSYEMDDSHRLSSAASAGSRRLFSESTRQRRRK